MPHPPGDAFASFQVTGLFPTPLIVAALDKPQSFNEQLTATILARAEREPGAVVSNVGGWHSTDLLSWSGEGGGSVIDAAREMVDRMTLMDSSGSLVQARVSWRISAWANVHRAGDRNRPHAHPAAFWSGIYWVDDGGANDDESIGGLLEFTDPRGVMPLMHAPHLFCAVQDCVSMGGCQTVTPKAGTMVLFPSWLVHSVTAYDGDRPRISIAFNFSL